MWKWLQLGHLAVKSREGWTITKLEGRMWMGPSYNQVLSELHSITLFLASAFLHCFKSADCTNQRLFFSCSLKTHIITHPPNSFSCWSTMILILFLRSTAFITWHQMPMHAYYIRMTICLQMIIIRIFSALSEALFSHKTFITSTVVKYTSEVDFLVGN